MASRTRAASRPVERAQAAPSRWKPLLVGGAIGLAIAVLVAGIIYVNHRVDQSSCRHFAEEVVAAMGDGVTNPPPSPAGLDPATAKAVHNARANYQKQLAAISPSLPAAEQAQRRQVLTTLWLKFKTRTEAYVRQSRGC
jgi:hypothetical protein